MTKTNRLTIASMCLALGIILPQASHFMPEIAKQLSIMHIPVYVAGIVCGPLYGGLVGIFSPLFSMLLFSMPNGMSLYSMMIELCAYGLFGGLLYRSIKTHNDNVNIYLSFIGSMIIGKIIYGICNALIFKAGEYSFNIWISAAFISGIVGILVQIIIVPPLCIFLKRKIKL